MLAPFPSRFDDVAGLRFIDANGPLGSRGEKLCPSAEMAARTGCVWSVDVKDPTRLLSTRQPSPSDNLIKGVPQPNGEAIRRTADRGTGLHPNLFSTSRISAGLSALGSAVASWRRRSEAVSRLSLATLNSRPEWR